MTEATGYYLSAPDALRPKFVLAVRAWCRSEVKCEMFDRALPGSFSPHEPSAWVPRDLSSRTLMLRNARELMRVTVLFLTRHEVPDDDIAQAKRLVRGMSFREQEAEALSDEEFSK